jgi:hypothetical protein
MSVLVVFLTLGTMHEYEYACLGYFDTKDVAPEKQV